MTVAHDPVTVAFVDAKSNVALLGPPGGVGKTMLAVDLAVAACQAATRSTSPASTTSCAGCAPPRPPAGSPASCRPTYAPPSGLR